MDQRLAAQVAGVWLDIRRWMRRAVARVRNRVQMGMRTIAKSGRRRIHVGRVVDDTHRDKYLIFDRTQPSTTDYEDSVTTFRPEAYQVAGRPMRRM